MDYETVLVVGGSGFIGSHVVKKLVDAGKRVTVPTRRRERAKHLLPLPTVDVVEGDISTVFLEHLIAEHNAVINLVGILHSRQGVPFGVDFERAHVELPARIVTALAEKITLPQPRYLHMSALGAASNGPSMYLRSKAAGEAAALSESSVATTIFRPSVVFGYEDQFLNMFASMQARLPIMPLAGAHTRFQPIFVEDVAQAFVNGLDNSVTFGKTYELAGTKVYTLQELVEMAGRASGHPRPVIPLPDALGRLQAWLLEHLPGQLMSRDNLDSMKVDNVASQPLAKELNVQLHALADIAPLYLAVAHPRTRMDEYRKTAHR